MHFSEVEVRRKGAVDKLRACQWTGRPTPSPIAVLVPLALSFALGAHQVAETPSLAALHVIVSCPLLDAEQASAVEARVQADFLAEGSPGGRLTLSCPDERAVAQFEGGGQPIDVEQPRAPDEPADALLRVAYEMASKLTTAQPPPDAAPVPETPTTPQPAPASAAPQAEPRRDVEGSDVEERAAEQASVEVNLGAPPELPRKPRNAVILDVGALAEHWGQASAGTLGVELGLEGALTEGLGLGGKATFATGWGLPDQLDVKSITAGLFLAKTVVTEWLTLRAGPAYSVMSFSGEGLTPQHVTTTSLAGDMDLLLTPGKGVRCPWLSLGLRAYARDRRVQVGEEQLLRVPRLAGLFGLGLRF